MSLKRITSQAIHVVTQIDDHSIREDEFAVFPSSEIMGESPKSTLFEVGSTLNVVVHMIDSETNRVFSSGYLGQFGPTFKLGEVIQGKIAPIISLNGSLSTGCENYNAENGKVAFASIVIVARGHCTFAQKSYIASLYHALAVLIVNDKNEVMYMSYEPGTMEQLRIPSISVPRLTGDLLMDKCLHFPCGHMIRLIGGGIMTPSATVLNIKNTLVYNSYAIEPDQDNREYWKRRSDNRGSSIIDAGVDISCLIWCNSGDKYKSCKKISFIL